MIAVVVPLGMGLLFVGIVFSPLMFIFSACLTALLNMMVFFLGLCVKFPWAYFRLEGMSVWAVVLYYFLLVLIIWGIKKLNGKNKSINTAVTT